MADKSLDTLYTLNTPEGIDLTLSPAGVMPRLLAWLIDSLIRFGIYTVVLIVLAFLGRAGMGIALIIIFIIEWFYPVYFEVFKQGQTPGKRALNLYVALDNGCPISMSASMIRNILRFVDFLPLFYGFGLISMLLNRRFQRLGDLVAGTVVFYKEDQNLVYQQTSEPEGQTLKAIMPPISLQIEEQQAVLAFYQRQQHLSRERAEELAELTGLLVADAPKEQKTMYLTSLARWIEGKR
ncbi:MAG: RDD family protein [Cocleimonas sp.]|nr:RDD family protein [Cocleimonas sp.]